jgi:hypothetical protein
VPRLEGRDDYELIIENDPARVRTTAGWLGCYSFFKREWNRLVKDNDKTAIKDF